MNSFSVSYIIYLIFFILKKKQKKVRKDKMSFAKVVLDETFTSLQARYPNKKITLARVQSGAEHLVDTLDHIGNAIVHVGKRFTPVYHMIRGQNLDEFIPMFAGLIMCFFGSYYTMIIAVIETMRVLCW